ncbi:MAG: hypothetical protein ABIK98_16060 [Pseudomonadota bacterium]
MERNGEQLTVIGDQGAERLYHLCETQAAYNSNFTPENGVLSPKLPPKIKHYTDAKSYSIFKKTKKCESRFGKRQD